MTEAQSVADNTVHDALVFEVMPIGREVTCDDILTRMGDKRPLGFRGYGVRYAVERINKRRQGAIKVVPFSRTFTFYVRQSERL